MSPDTSPPAAGDASRGSGYPPHAEAALTAVAESHDGRVSAPAGWAAAIELGLALHDLALAGYELTGNHGPLDEARAGVASRIEAAIAGGVPEPEVDRVLKRWAESDRVPAAG